MGKLAVYRYFSMMFLVITVVVMLFTFGGLFGGRVDPVGNTAMAMLVYILPVLIFMNVLLLIYWLVRRRWKWIALPIIPIICCIPYMGTLLQLRPPTSDVEDYKGLMVATYNVQVFGHETTGFKAEDILAEMKRQKVQVLCLQEYAEMSGDKKNSENYKTYFPYMAMGKNDMVIFSRYPIKESSNIAFSDPDDDAAWETNQSAMWATIEIEGKLIRVFNVHLETTGFSRTMHHAKKILSAGHHVEDNRLIRAIYGNYTLGMIVRSGQARIVANEIAQSKEPCIVCGDFNDVPYSYTYHTMLGNLVDGFKECGSGFMYTFREPKKPVRIDYIFHDESMEGITYYTKDISYSDHLPVFMKLTLEKEE
jgi:endonuclease/exonuclease/phosphatase family metal-dependent hydrolase